MKFNLLTKAMYNIKVVASKVYSELQKKAGIVPYDTMIVFESPERSKEDVLDLLFEDGYNCELDKDGNIWTYRADAKDVKEAMLLYGCTNTNVIKKGVD